MSDGDISISCDGDCGGKSFLNRFEVKWLGLEQCRYELLQWCSSSICNG